MLNNYIAIATCTVLAQGVLACFGYAAYRAYRDAAKWLQRNHIVTHKVQCNNVAPCTLNTPLPTHNER